MGNAPSIRSFSIFNSQLRFFIEEEYTLHRLFQQPRGFNRQLEGRVVFIATMVCRDTPSSFAMSSCRKPRALRSSLILFFIFSARTSISNLRISRPE